MKKIKTVLALGLILILQGCDRYLEVKTYGKAIPQSSEEFSAILHNYLNQVDYGRDQVLIDNATEILVMESVTDNFNATLTLPGGRVGLPLYIGAQINNKQLRYQKLYEVIRDANIVIDNMTSSGSQDDDNVLGTAHAFRAIAYLHLLREYCEPYESDDQLGLALVKHFDMEERVLRSDYGTTRSFIESEFKKAIEYKVDDEIYRYTEDVVKAYLARFYFWTRNWEGAIELSKELIDKHPLITGQSYSSMLQAVNERKGNVFLRSYLFKGEMDMATSTAQDMIQMRPVSKSFMKLFDDDSKDIRYELSVNEKRISQKYLSGKIRAAEMLLVLSESYLHVGEEVKALALINQLRDMRINGNIHFTIQSLPLVREDNLIKVNALGLPLTPIQQLILDERRKELFLEGDRFYELKRNGRPTFWVADNGLKYSTLPYLYTFPIPRIDIELTPGLEQNKGYTF